jgi:NAD(P)-dependent dehydrogenase (short-subunit alcohol dehydrogenase family)
MLGRLAASACLFLLVTSPAFVSSMTSMSLPLRPCVLITGSTDGIGLTTAKNMARKGYDILLHGRDSQRIEAAKAAVQDCCRDKSSVYALPPIDISTVAAATQLAQHVRETCQQHNLHLSILVNNAGVFSESLVWTTDDKVELTFAVNVLAAFVITSLLLPLLLEQASNNQDARIVIASSISQSSSIQDWTAFQYQGQVSGDRRLSYSAHAAYSESKLLDAMLSMEFADRLDQYYAGRRSSDNKEGSQTSRLTCNCLDPGTVNTKMLLAGWGPCGMDVDDALDETWLCTSDQVQNKNGRYFVHRTDRKTSAAAYNVEERRKLWSLLTDLAPDAASVWDQLVADDGS